MPAFIPAEIAVPIFTDISAISGGAVHVVAIRQDGRLVAWGDDSAGKTTIPPEAQSGVTAISAGNTNTAALKQDGSVVVWGSNFYGQTTIPPEAQGGVAAIATGGGHMVALKQDGGVVAWGRDSHGQATVPSEAQSGVATIAVGDYHTVALKQDGSVVAWGRNDYGQTTVPAATQSGVTAIAVGYYHTVVLKNGGVVVWGNNDSGQATVPTEAQSGVIAIASGWSHVAALKQDGSVVVWGGGIGTSGQTIRAVPPAAQSGVAAISAGSGYTVALKQDGAVVAWGGGRNRETSVTALSSSVTALAATNNHMVALKDDGGVLAWGNNASGQTTVPAAAQSGITAIGARNGYTLALKQDGGVLAWGNNSYGQTTVPAAAQSGVTAIAAGGVHALALKQNGSVVAWGNNSYGQTTVPAAAQSGVTAIAAGNYHAVALKQDGTVVAWGDSAYTSVPPEAQSGVTAIAAGLNHTVALTQNGSVVAWGSNSSGQTTVPAAALVGVIAIAAGDEHTVALKQDGSVVAWGVNIYGFYGEINGPIVPSSVTAIAAGGRTSFYRLAGEAAPPSLPSEIVVEQPADTGLENGGSRDFGLQDAGSPASLVFTVRNAGTGALLLGTGTVSGANAADFAVTTQPFSPVPPGESTTFTVRFIPSDLGSRQATLRFGTNDADENPFEIQLAGTGQEPAVLPAATFNPSALSILPGDGMVLNPSVTGTTPIMFEWFEGQTGDTSTPLDGTDSSLSVSPEEDTFYWVRVTNRGGTVNGGQIKVIVIRPYPQQGDDNIITNVTADFEDDESITEVRTAEVSGTTWVVFLRGGRLYSVPFQGGVLVELTAGIENPGISSGSISDLSTSVPRHTASGRRWTISGDAVFFYAITPRRLYRVPLAGGTPVDLSGAAGSVQGFVISQDGATAFFATSHLYRVPTSGGAPMQMTSGLSPFQFCLTPNGSHLVFAAAPADVNNAGLYSLPVGATTATTPLRLNNPNPPADSVAGRGILEFQINSLSNRVVYKANDDAGYEQQQLFSAAITSASRVSLEASANSIVRAFSISPDGSRVAYHARLDGQTDYRLHTIPVAGGSRFTVAGASQGADSAPVFTADSQRLLAQGFFAPDEGISQIALFNAASSGHTLVSETPPGASADFVTPGLAPGSGAVLYEATSATPGGPFLKAASPSGTDRRILDATLLGGALQPATGQRYLISPTGQRVLFVKNGDRVNANDLYTSAIADGAIRRTHPPVTTHSMAITRYGAVGDGNSAWFVGNYASAGRFDLILSRMPTPIPPAIVEQSSSTTLDQGQSVALSVTTEGTPVITYQWFTGESGVTTSPIGGATGATYTTPALTGLLHRYWVRATNHIGSVDSATIVITLNQPPAITVPPASQTVLEGESTSLSVTATGTGPLTYAWYQGASGDTTHPVGLNSSTFNTGPILADTRYWVRISSPYGTAESAAAEITMTPRIPVFTSPATANAVQGIPFEFQIITTYPPNVLTSPNLPAWLALDPATGVLNGTPPTVGNVTLDLVATNPYRSSQSTLALTILPQKPVITSAPTFAGRQNDPFTYTVTATQSPVSFTIGTLPGGLQFNPATGVISGTPTVSGTFTIPLSALNAGGAGTGTLTLFLAPPIPPPVILNPAFVAGTANTAFSLQATASNSPTAFALGEAPAWLTISAAGLLSGTPPLPGTYSFTIRASNQSGFGAFKTVPFTVEPHPQAPAITSIGQALGRKDVAFSFQPATSVAATSFAIVSGTLPPGVAFSTASGAFSGTPTTPGTYDLTLHASNAFGPGKDSALKITIRPPLQIPAILLSSFNASVGQPFSGAVTASNAPTSFTFTGLPAWLVQNGVTGTISGTPPIAGVFTFAATATNDDGTSAEQTITLTVAYHPNAPRLQLPAGLSGYQGVVFTHVLQTSPAATGVTATGLPPGIQLIVATRTLAGTPEQIGEFPVTLQASNASGLGEPLTIVFKVLATPDAPRIISSFTEVAKALEAFTYQIQAQSELPVTGYTATGLPAGLTLNATTGLISGTPQQVGEFQISLSASSAVGQGQPQTLALTVRPGDLLPQITSTPSAQATAGVPFTYQTTAKNGPITAWSATGLPEGLTINTLTGLISGTPTQPGAVDVLLAAANVNGAGPGQTLRLAVSIAPGAPIVVIPNRLGFYLVQPFSMEIQTLGMPPKPWRGGDGVFAENLPAGMNLNTSTGVLSGSPTGGNSGWKTYSSGFYAKSGGAIGTKKTVEFHVNYVSGTRPIITGPKSLTVRKDKNLSFTITTNIASLRYYLGIFDGAYSSGAIEIYQDPSLFNINLNQGGYASLRPGFSPYDLSAYSSATSSWGDIFGLPLRIDPATGSPVISSPEYLIGQAGTPLAATLTASGGATSFEAQFDPSLPSGVSFNAATGVFSGTPTVPGSYSFLARARNAVGWSLPQFTTLAILPAPSTGMAARSVRGLRGVRSSPAQVTGQVGVFFDHAPAYPAESSYFVASGLPQGLVLNQATGRLSGVPEQPGLFTAKIRPFGETAVGEELSVPLLIHAAAGTPVMAAGLEIPGVAGTALDFTLTASGSPVGFNLGEDRPGFIEFDPFTGKIGGVPVVPGRYPFQVSGFNAAGDGFPVTVTLVIAPAPGTPVTTPASQIAAAQVGVPFSLQLTASPAPDFYDGQSLPYGLSLDGATGVISGTPLVAGINPVEFWGVNAAGQGGSALVEFRIAGAAGTPVISTPGVLQARQGEFYEWAFAATPGAESFSLTPIPSGLDFDPTTGVLSGTPATGVYTFQVTGLNDLGAGTPKTIRLEVYGSASSLWQAQQFGEDAADPAIAGWEANPSGDGLSNIVKYALGLPAFADAQEGLPRRTLETVGGEEYFVFTIDKNPDADDVEYLPEINTSLEAGSWQSGPAHFTILEETSTLLKVRENQPAGSQARRFFRLSVRLNAP